MFKLDNKHRLLCVIFGLAPIGIVYNFHNRNHTLVQKLKLNTCIQKSTGELVRAKKTLPEEFNEVKR